MEGSSAVAGDVMKYDNSCSLCLLKRSERHWGHHGLWCSAKHIFPNASVITAPASPCQWLCSYCSGLEHGDRIQATAGLHQPSSGVHAVQLGLWDTINVSSVFSQFRVSEAMRGLRCSPLQRHFYSVKLRIPLQAAACHPV